MDQLAESFQNKLRINRRKPNLSDLPVDIVEQIVKETNLPTRLSLRKVCRTLRTLVDRQDPICDSIGIYVNFLFIELNLDGRRITYNRTQLLGKPRKTIRSVMETMFTDLKTFMTHPKFLVKTLKVEFFDDYSFGIFLKLQLKHFELGIPAESFSFVMHDKQETDTYAYELCLHYETLKTIKVYIITTLGNGMIKTLVKDCTELEKTKNEKGQVLKIRPLKVEIYEEIHRKNDLFHRENDFRGRENSGFVARPNNSNGGVTKQWNPYFSKYHMKR